MPIDAWLPVGFALPDGVRVRLALHEGVDWQIVETQDGGRALVARQALGDRWVDGTLLDAGVLASFAFGGDAFAALSSGASHTLAPVAGARSPSSKTEALAFASALRDTRRVDPSSALHDAIYVEKVSRLLPTYTFSPAVPDDVVLGTWLAGGVPVSVTAFRRLRALVGWLGEPHLREVLGAAGMTVPATAGGAVDRPEGEARFPTFALPGRPELERFLVEHVIDIVEHRDRYRALGIAFPSAIVLHGPPGCGKTFAIERLVEYLGWPSFRIDASSVASPYIHETSRKVAEVFDGAMKQAPSVVVIDEMEAFLADRGMGPSSSLHHVEEVAEFLRRIPEAGRHEVLVVAMTNRIEMIDHAILRRGRFDHVVKVDMPTEPEVRSLLDTLLAQMPRDPEIDLGWLADALQGRPLSDAAFVVKEAARLAARAGKDKLDEASFRQALEASPARDGDGSRRKIGFL